MQSQPELPDVDAHGTVIERTVVGGFAKGRMSDLLLGELARMPMQGALGEEKEVRATAPTSEMLDWPQSFQ